MAVVPDCGFELVDHPSYSPDLASSDYFLFPNKKTTLGREAALGWWLGHICFFWGSGWEVLYHWNPSAATPMAELSVWTAGKTMLKNKLHLVKFDYCIIASLWTFQPTQAFSQRDVQMSFGHPNTVRAEIFAVVLFSRISRVKPSRKFPLQFMSIYSNDNISKIAKLTTRELPHLAKTAKIMAYTVSRSFRV